MSIVTDVKHWRSRVEETLLVARSLKHEEARRVTLELALVYGRLAEIAERRQAQQSASAASAVTKPADPPKSRATPSPLAPLAPKPSRYVVGGLAPRETAMNPIPPATSP